MASHIGEIAERLVEEWLNRSGFFTIRGARQGSHEMDFLAMKFGANNFMDLRHYEVHASCVPVGTIAGSAKILPSEEMATLVDKWITKKFTRKEKKNIRETLVQGKWSYHFVVHDVKSQAELQMIKDKLTKINHEQKMIINDSFPKDSAISRNTYVVDFMQVVDALRSDNHKLKKGLKKGITCSANDLVELIYTVLLSCKSDDCNPK